MTETTLFAVAPAWPVLTVIGPDAASWLNGIITCDTKLVSEGQGGWGLLLSRTGKIQAELQLVGSSSHLWLGVSGGSSADAQATLEHFLVMEDAELEVAPASRFFCLYGPGALDVGRQLSTTASAMPWINGEAAALVVNETELLDTREQARALGAVDGEPGFGELRIALGLPLYGVDFGERDNPHEASLERRAVSWSKGCYLGQEVVCMQDMRGRVKRRLARLEGPGVPWAVGSAVLSPAAVPVGRVTTAGRDRAIASLESPWFEAKEALTVLGQPVRVLPLDRE